MSVEFTNDFLGQKEKVLDINFDNKKDVAIYTASDDIPSYARKINQLLFYFFENSENDLVDNKIRSVLIDGIKGKGYIPKDEDEKAVFDKIKCKLVLSMKFFSVNEVNQLIELLTEIKESFDNQ